MTGTARDFKLSREKMANDRAIASSDRQAKKDIASADRKSRENIATKDRAQRKKEMVANTFNSTVGTLGKVLSAKPLNSPEWYKRYTTNMGVFTSVPTFTRLGDKLPGKYGVKVPGIAVLRWYSTVGNQKEYTLDTIAANPINQILMRSKEQILKLNSRSSVPWEAADLGLNFYAARELLAILLEVKRVIGVALKFDATNLYIGDMLIRALGFDADDFRSHLAQYKVQFEIWRSRFNKAIVAPKSLTLYDRTEFLTSTIFVDNPTASMHQIYAYVHRPDAWLRLSDLGDACEKIPMESGAHTLYTYATLVPMVNSMFQRLAENPDFIQMFADMRHAFGDDLWQIESIPMDYDVPIVYDEELLLQFKNTVTLPVTLSAPGLVNSIPTPTSGIEIHSLENGYLFQGVITDGLNFRNTWTNSLADNSEDYLSVKTYMTQAVALSLVDSKGYTAEDQFVVNTRNTMLYSVSVQETAKTVNFLIYSCGTEAFTDFNVIQEPSAAGTYWHDYYGSWMVGSGTNGIDVAKQIFPRVSILSKFDWMCPVCFEGFEVYEAFIAEWNKFVVVSKDQIEQLHMICTLSELYLSEPRFNSKV